MAIKVIVDNYAASQSVIFERDNDAKAFMFDAFIEDNAEPIFEDVETCEKFGQMDVYRLYVEEIEDITGNSPLF